MNPPHRSNNEAGYSLIEVLVAALILTGSLLPMATMFDMALQSSRTGGDLDTARSIAHKNLEDIRALDYPEAIDRYDLHSSHPGSADCPSGSSPGKFDCSIKADVYGENLDPISVPGSRTLVTVTVEWDGHEYEASQLLTASEP